MNDPAGADASVGFPGIPGVMRSPAATPIEAALAELSILLGRALPRDGTLEAMPGLHLSRASGPTKPVHFTYEPTLCVVVQGKKRLTLADDHYDYDPAHYFLTAVALPIASHVVEASPARPYLCLGMRLDPALVSSVLIEAAAELDRPALDPRASTRAVDVAPVDFGLLDAVLRLVRLVDSPRDARVLAPLVRREIVYRLHAAGQGARLAALASFGGQAHRIAKAIAWLRDNFEKPLRVEALGREVGMSASALHHHFRTVTGVSPLQFQKRLRLQQARHLMLSEQLDAASAAFRVGYNDASQFSREYRRLFGAPPLRDVALRRGAGKATGSVLPPG